MRGYTEDENGLQKRLQRIEGQVRGLQRMVDEDIYCIEILTQISAATKALQAVALSLLEGHLRHCVHEAIAPATRPRTTRSLKRPRRSAAWSAPSHERHPMSTSTRTYSVEGMTCGHCVNAITGEVTKVAGINDVAVDLEAKTVTVAGETVNDAAVRAAVDEAGYTVVG